MKFEEQISRFIERLRDKGTKDPEISIEEIVIDQSVNADTTWDSPTRYDVRDLLEGRVRGSFIGCLMKSDSNHSNTIRIAYRDLENNYVTAIDLIPTGSRTSGIAEPQRIRFPRYSFYIVNGDTDNAHTYSLWAVYYKSKL